MKRYVYIIICVAALTALHGCTQNNGRIGSLFGTWVLTAMDVDGEPDAGFMPDATTWDFQNNIVNIELRTGVMDLETSRRGTWSREGDCLLLNYTHSDDDHEAGTGIYAAPEWLHFAPCSVTKLQIVSESGRSMTLRMEREGHTYTYLLNKTW